MAVIEMQKEPRSVKPVLFVAALILGFVLLGGGIYWLIKPKAPRQVRLTGEQAKLNAARQAITELESRFAELEAGVAEGEKGIRRKLGRRAPRGEVVLEAWVETQVAALARSRKANEEAQARLAAAPI